MNKSRLHIILCQNTQQKKTMDSPILKRLAESFPGQVVGHYYNRSYFRWLNARERIVLLVRAMMASRRGDYIFLEGQGLLWLMLLMSVFRGRHILYWNLIFYTNIHSYKNAFLCQLVKKANKWGGVNGTVNAPELQKIYSEVFQSEEWHFPLVYDPMELPGLQERQYNREGPIFFGGRARRDVDCFVRIVERLPEEQFLAIIPKSMVSERMRRLQNLEILTDIPVDDFYDKLRRSSVCCIPLKRMEPCGLYVMQHAILMGIPIVSTKTYSMRTIVPDDSCGFLCERGDDETMVSRIRQIRSDGSLRETITSNALVNMKTRFSNDAVAHQMARALQSIVDKYENN